MRSTKGASNACSPMRSPYSRMLVITPFAARLFLPPAAAGSETLVVILWIPRSLLPPSCHSFDTVIAKNLSPSVADQRPTSLRRPEPANILQPPPVHPCASYRVHNHLVFQPACQPMLRPINELLPSFVAQRRGIKQSPAPPEIADPRQRRVAPLIVSSGPIGDVLIVLPQMQHHPSHRANLAHLR